jgi:hypothetical protein
MTRTLADLEAALVAEAALEVNTEKMRSSIEHGATARRRRRSIAMGAGLAAVVALSVVVATRPGPETPPAGSEPLATDCTITVLPLPAALSGLDENIVGNLIVDGMDPTGRFVLASYDRSTDDVVLVVRWDHGVPSLLPLNGASLVAHGVNAQGTVVGGQRDDGGHAWFYSNEAGFTGLATPPGFASAIAYAINDLGDIAGEAVAAHGYRAAVVWSVDRQYAPRVLSAPGSSGARGINGDGIMVGYAASSDDEESGRPYAWHPLGEGTFLSSPRDYNFGHATQIRGEWAVGFGWRSVTDVNGTTQERVALRWSLASDTVTTVDGWRGPPFIGVRTDGAVATETTAGPTMIKDGQAYRLPRHPQDRSALLNPVAMSDDGLMIVGRQVGVPRQPVVLWRC